MESPHFCYDCTFKHLSAARVLYNEIANGYMNVDHISYLVGNMALAETHIFERHPDIAEAVRKERKAFWDGLIVGDLVRPEFEKLLQHVYAAAVELGEIEAGDELGDVDMSMDLSQQEQTALALDKLALGKPEWKRVDGSADKQAEVG